jgi:hypothetical protein
MLTIYVHDNTTVGILLIWSPSDTSSLHERRLQRRIPFDMSCHALLNMQAEAAAASMLTHRTSPNARTSLGPQGDSASTCFRMLLTDSPDKDLDPLVWRLRNVVAFFCFRSTEPFFSRSVACRISCSVICICVLIAPLSSLRHFSASEPKDGRH